MASGLGGTLDTEFLGKLARAKQVLGFEFLDSLWGQGPVARTAISHGDPVLGGAAVPSPELGSEDSKPDRHDTELPGVLMIGLSLDAWIMLQL